MANKLRLVLGALFFALMFISIGASFRAAWLEKAGASRRGWEAMKINDKSVIYRVDSDGPITELKAGDEIVSLESQSPAVFPLLYQDRCDVPPGSAYTLIIRRSGELQTQTLKTIEFSLPDRVEDWIFNTILLAFLITALTVFLLKSRDQQAWLLALMLGTFAGLFQGFAFGLSGWLLGTLVVARVIGLAFLPLFFHFFLIFPERGPWLRRFPKLEYLLYLPFFLTILPFSGLQRIGDSLNIENLADWLPARILLGMAAMVFVISYLVGGLVGMVGNYRAANPNSQRKLRFVVAGCSLGCLNLLLLILGEFLGFPGTRPVLYDWMRAPLLVTLPLIPLSFAYAIIRHQVIPISLIIRRSVRYVLVSRGSVLLELLAVFAVVTALLTYVFNRLQPPGIVIGTVSAASGVAVWKLSSWLHDKYLAPVIDRRFFRESYNSHQIIADLASELRTVTSLPQLLELVSTKIQSALKTENVTIFLRDDATGDFRSAYSCDFLAADGRSISRTCDSRLPCHTSILERAADNGSAFEVELPDIKSGFEDNGGRTGWENDGRKERENDGRKDWMNREKDWINGDSEAKAGNESQSFGNRRLANGWSEAEIATLREVNAALILPLAAKDEMLGLISLGPRLGDLPFSREDKHLLMSVAGPTTFALENARLLERMIEEARRREEIEAENEQRAKELEEARQLQLSMLPKSIPQLPHLEIAAYMKTATEVGGDYYDFHQSDNGELTVAVGDATGHGLKAGTVVTAMKSMFHCFADEPELLPVMNRSSRVLKSMNLRSLFMGLTVVKLKDDRLRISSAGMPPVLIYRARNRRVEEVLIKAMPLGSISSYNYREEELTVTGGDVVVLMSDGFPERFNRVGEMFDYWRVNESLAEVADLSPSQIIEHFVSDGDTWADGRPQDDDVTFVVLKVK